MPRIGLLSCLAFACSGCAALADSDEPSAGKAPDIACEGCYVVNATVSGAGRSVFVGGYADLGRGLVRRYQDGDWGTLLDSVQLGEVSKVFATEHELYVSAASGVTELDLDKGKANKLDVAGTAVWAAGHEDIVVVEDGKDHRFDGSSWREQPFTISFPKVISGPAHDDLYALSGDGTVSHSDGGPFAPLGEQPSVAANDLWDAGELVLAVAGDDHGEGVTGPGAILGYDGEHWVTLQDAPEDALLGVASSRDEPIYAVGATNDHGQVRAVVWRFADMRWSRHVLANVQAFLWDAWCSDDGDCYAVGTDNTFIDLRDL